ncbi:MAG: TROVE domain-containing protein, partial [Pseudanabaena sp.]
MSYKFLFQKPKSTPQTQAIAGREAEMIQGRSGGFAFDAGIWRMLRRCLLIGTAQSTYYAGKHELSGDFIDTVQKCVAEDADRVKSEILYASDGRAVNNSAPILALVLLSMGDSQIAKRNFMEIFPQVVRTGSHFYEWMNYTKSMRGFGKIIRESGKAWL